VSAPFFNLWMVPIGLTLLFLTGVGPLIAWRKATPSNLRFQFTNPLIAFAVTMVACLAFGLHTRAVDADIGLTPPDPSSTGPLVLAVKRRPARVRHREQEVRPVICFALCAFVVTAIVQEFARGVAIRKRNTGQSGLSALIGMILRGKRRYGGYLVHVGIVFMFFGFAGSAYQKEETAKLAPGQSAKIGDYTVRFDKLAHEEDRQKEMVTGELTALVGGKVIDKLRPAKWFFHKHENEPTTEVAIRRAPAEDLYVTLGNYDLAEGTATLKLVVNPVVDWIWFGFMLIAIATGVVMLPETVMERWTARAAATAAAGGRAPGAVGLVLLLALGAGGALLLAPQPAAAQMAGGSTEAPNPSGPTRTGWCATSSASAAPAATT
jgi:cytochrome c-type biogenesis protein CcmF